MINASKEFKEKLKNGANVVNYADITLSDGTVLHLEPKDFMIGGCRIEDKTTDGKFGVGFVIGKTAAIKIANHNEQFSQYDFFNSIIYLYVALMLDDGRIEKIRKGKYCATVPETPGNIIEISAVDDMYKLDRDYSSSRTTYPATLQTIISYACLDCGIPIGFRQFDNMNYVVQSKPEKATYRQVVSYACQIAGYNARIDNDGYMQLIWYNVNALDVYTYIGGDFKTYPHDTIIYGGDFKDYSTDRIIRGATFSEPVPEHIFRIKSLEVHTDDVQITGVRVVGDEEAVALFGEEGYVIEVSGNPFVNGKEREVADYLGKRMVGMMFRPLSAQILNNPLYEPFDVIRVSDVKGSVYNSVLNSISYTIGGYTSIACEAENPIRQGSTYASAAAQAVVEARRNVEKQLTTYDKAVQQMNQTAANAMGLFFAIERSADGSIITYESTKPITVDDSGKCHFDPNSTVYKKTGDGFFVSRDGGLSYTAGFDSQGNAVLNVLYAIGISADWINTGNLSADRIQGGTLTLGGRDNQYGRFLVLNAYGEPFLGNDGNTLNFDNGYLHFSEYVYAVPGPGYTSETEISGSFIVTQKKSEKGGASINSSGRISLWGKSGDEGADIRAEGATWYDNAYLHFYGGEVKLYNGCSLYVDGTKNRIVKTQNYQERLQYCYEMPSPMFGDIGNGKTDEDGACYIFIDDIFRETIDTDCQYQVFLQKYGQGDLWVEERTEDYFIVKGAPNLSFSWEIKAKQLGYDIERLELFEDNKEEPLIDYEVEFDNYVKTFYKEVTKYDSNN